MAGRRCSICNITYPTSYTKCLVCEDETWFADNLSADDDWKEAVGKQKEELKEYLEKAHEFDLTEVGPIPDAKATISEYNGMLWVPHAELIAAGYRNLEDFAVVLIEGTFYELQGHVGRYSKHMPGGAWWVEIVDTPEITDDGLSDFLKGGDKSGSEEEDADRDHPLGPEAPEEDGLQ